MVIPFLSLYLTEDQGLSLSQVGIIMSCFGLGSVVGSWLGGKLTDAFGYYKVMWGSLFFSGILFIALQYIDGFVGLCFGVFSLLVVADTFRPATFVALSAYSKPENRTRSVSLIRLAINLGFSAGPALAGIIIETSGYSSLFWIDGGSCIAAAFLLMLFLHPKKATATETYVNTNPKSVYTDLPYWVFFAAMALFAFCFVQYFSTVPLYYHQDRNLSEFTIGILLGMSGFLIFIFEMPLVKYLEKWTWTKTSHVMTGFVLTAFSFLVLNLGGWIGMVAIGLVLMAFGEMIAFPFSNAFAMDRANRGKQGEYMALYTISFSLAHVFAHNFGTWSADKFGWFTTWNIITGVCIIAFLLLLWLQHLLNSEKTQKNVLP
jgi:predicted MFS family arabinose efflux permease